jgi:hypothetical protein
MSLRNISLIGILVGLGYVAALAISVDPPTLQDIFKRSDLVALVRIIDANPIVAGDQEPLRCGVRYSAQIKEVFSGNASVIDFFAPTVFNEIPGEGLLLGREYLLALTSIPQFHTSFTDQCGTPKPPYLAEHFSLQSTWQTEWYDDIHKETANSCGEPPYLEIPIGPLLRVPAEVRTCTILPKCDKVACEPSLLGLHLVSWPDLRIRLQSMKPKP